MLFTEKPADFNPTVEVVSCFCEHNGRILLLLRREGKEEAGTWCLPGGKRHKGETIEEAAARELREESGIDVPSQELQFYRSLFVRYPTYDFIYTLFHLFHVTVSQEPEVQLSVGEHTQSIWVTPAESLKLPLITDLAPCIKMFYHL